MRTLQLENKNILVTGSEGYLGKSIMSALRDEGANPIGADLNGAEFKLDLADEKTIWDLHTDVCKKYNNIHGLVNNAAISFKGGDINAEEFNKTLAVNVTGTDNCIYWFSKTMRNASIVNIASLYGHLSPDFRVYEGDKKQYNSVAYGASKAGVIQLTKYRAVMLASQNIRVNAVSPGGIFQNHLPEFNERYSDRVPMGRMALPSEITDAVLFLLSPRSSYITGQNLKVDGGLSAW